MGRLSQVMAAFRRGAARLLPPGRRDWAAAVWAEAHEVPPGLARLAWRGAGSGCSPERRCCRAGSAARCCSQRPPRSWHGRSGRGHGSAHVAEGRFNAIAPVLLVAVLPWLARRFFGSASPSRFARSLRVLCCATVLALVPAFTVLLVFNRRAPLEPAWLNIFCGGQGCAGVIPGESSGGPPASPTPHR